MISRREGWVQVVFFYNPQTGEVVPDEDSKASVNVCNMLRTMKVKFSDLPVVQYRIHFDCNGLNFFSEPFDTLEDAIKCYNNMNNKENALIVKISKEIFCGDDLIKEF